MKRSKPSTPRVASELSVAQTPAQRLTEALRSGEWLTSKELSQRAQLSEKELPQVLEKVQRSLRGESMERESPRCLACGFQFDERQRFRRPSRCPECKSERITPVRLRLLVE